MASKKQIGEMEAAIREASDAGYYDQAEQLTMDLDSMKEDDD